jgi:ribulose kinase
VNAPKLLDAGTFRSWDESSIPGRFAVRMPQGSVLCQIRTVSGSTRNVIHPEWWTRSLADAQEQVSGGQSAFGEVVDSLVADLLTSQEFLSFLLAETTARMADGGALDEAFYAVTEEVAAQMQRELP